MYMYRYKCNKTDEEKLLTSNVIGVYSSFIKYCTIHKMEEKAITNNVA